MRKAGPRAKFWATVALVAITDLVLLEAGLITGATAVALFLTVEVAVTATSLILATRAARRAAKVDGAQLTTEQALARVLPRPVARFIMLEIRLFATLWAAATRRPLPSGTQGFTGRRGVGLLMGAAIGGTVIEAVAVHYLLPWPAARIAFAIINVYGLIWLISMWLGFRVHPHAVDAEKVVLRYSFWESATIPVTAIVSAQVETYMSSDSWYRVGTDGAFHASAGGQTNVLLMLSEGVDDVGGACRARVFVDDPEGFVAAVNSVVAQEVGLR